MSKQEIVNVLKEKGKQMSARQLFEEVGCNRSTLDVQLKKMRDANEIKYGKKRNFQNRLVYFYWEGEE